MAVARLAWENLNLASGESLVTVKDLGIGCYVILNTTGKLEQHETQILSEVDINTGNRTEAWKSPWIYIL